MKNKRSITILTIVAVVIGIVTIVAFGYYYFVRPIILESEKKEVLADEKFDLELLAMAYLNQNRDLKINDYIFNQTFNYKYEVAAEYCYLKNSKFDLTDYDEILKIAKSIFDDKNINFSNFVINIDDKKCGKEKYSTLEGSIREQSCDKQDVIYEIIDTYYQNHEYVVEFYASTAIQEKAESFEKCSNFEVPLSYNLKIIDLEQNEFYNENHFQCCLNECELEGISSLRSEVINQIKANSKIYKLVFRKVDDHFVFSKIKKVK